MHFVNNKLIDVKRTDIGRPQRFRDIYCHLLPRLAGNRYILLVLPCQVLIDIGRKAKKVAWHLLSPSWASLVATGTHDAGLSRVLMKAASERTSVKLSKDFARLVCIEIPSRLADGQDITRLRASKQQQAEW